jgi:LysM repeat protein
MGSRRTTAARYAAPVAFLVAATVGILLVRSALSDPTTETSTPPVTTAATTTTATTTTGATTTEPQAPGTTATGDGEFYEIQSGDTLETIAAQHSTTVEQLLVLNPDVDPVALSIGQRIRVE